jgi:glucose/arabinose dehydrogenase
MPHVPLALLAALLLAAGVAACGEEETAAPPPPAATQTPDEPASGDEEPELLRADGEAEVATVAEGFDVPWELAFLPDGRILVTERGGALRVVSAEGELAPEPLGEVPGVSAMGEGGLLGMAVDPAFDDNGFLYVYRTTDDGNEVVRLVLDGDELSGEATIVDGIPAAQIHNGGRLRFGPDDRLHITTGDAADPQSAQADGLAGKVLALGLESARGDGGDPETLTTGHRNVQGLAWQPESDRLFATEHGQSFNDEVNLLEEGQNYGWPDAEGPDHGEFTAPVAVFPDMPMAPSGATFVTLPGSAWTGDLLFGALAGEQVRRLSLDGASVTRNEALFEGELGRVRTVVEGPDGALYALTSNTDGRGSPRDGDDRLVRIIPPAA